MKYLTEGFKYSDASLMIVLCYLHVEAEQTGCNCNDRHFNISLNAQSRVSELFRVYLSISV